MHIPMVVAAFVATDILVLREAATFAVPGQEVHIIGKFLPSDFSTISTLPAGTLAPSGSRYGRCLLDIVQAGLVLLYCGFAPLAPTRYGSNRAVRANQ